MSITDLVAALAEKYGDAVDNDAVSSYLAEQGYDVSGLSPENLDDITSQVLELMLAEQAADADAAENPLSLSNNDYDDYEEMAKNYPSIFGDNNGPTESTVQRLNAIKAQKMANEDNTPVVEKAVDKDNDGDFDEVSIKKLKPKKDKKSEESEDDNAQESEDDPHETKLNSNLIDAVDRKY